MELLCEKYRTARKEHVCEFCYGKIEEGERYHISSVKDGDVYQFKTHCECTWLTNELIEFIDPWDGVTSDDFMESMYAFCNMFICGTCPQHTQECDNNESFCLHRIVECIKNYKLEVKNNKYKLIKRETPVSDDIIFGKEYNSNGI